MKSVFSSKKLLCILTPIALSILSMQAFADKTNGHGHPHPPIHLKSSIATLTPDGYSPSQIITAYQFPTDTQGEGQTIAVVEAYDNPNVEADLNVFSSEYGLPACTTANGCFTKIYAEGTPPTTDTKWGLEMSLDVQWIHAIAPKAKILLVEASTDDWDPLFNAIGVAMQNNPNVVSLSWGDTEFSGETDYDRVFYLNPTIPVVVSSGDLGYGVNYPAASPYVLSVGGTVLNTDGSGNYISETAWGSSGGGISTYEAEPAWQSSFPIPENPNLGRGVPDVAYNADPDNGFSIYDSFNEGGWLVVGGTSAGSPQWAAFIALLNAASGTNIASINIPLYYAAAVSPATVLHDVTVGSNGSCGFLCNAQVGYDYVTGFGSPQASNLIHFLITHAAHKRYISAAEILKTEIKKV